MVEKSLGQHFLINEDPINASIEASKKMGLNQESHVLEIGPGPGTLTRSLLKTGARVTSIEISADACDFLREEIKSDKFSLVQSDALKSPWPEETTHIIANIPYGISSPILRRIQDLHQSSALMGVCLLVQREFGNRMTMKIPSKDRGPLGISLWFDFDCQKVQDVPRSYFRPQPDVESSIITMMPVNRGPITPSERSLGIALSSWCFARRRRKIRTSLRSRPRSVMRLIKASTAEWDRILTNLETNDNDLGRIIQMRPEDLSPPQWIELAKGISSTK